MNAPGKHTIAIAILTTMDDHPVASEIEALILEVVPGAIGRVEVHADPSAVFVPMSEEDEGASYGPCPTCDAASVVDEGGACVHCGTPRGV